MRIRRFYNDLYKIILSFKFIIIIEKLKSVSVNPKCWFQVFYNVCVKERRCKDDS